MAVKGTPLERKAARAEQTRQNRAKFVKVLASNASNGRQLLVIACDYAKAVGRDLDDVGRRALARQIAELADGRNRP